MKELKIKFESMEILKDNKTVKISGDCASDKSEITMSVLQLAKVFNVDKEIVEEAENNFGSGLLEEKCKEIREIIEKFPDVDMSENQIVIEEVWTSDKKDRGYTEKGIIKVIGEDLCGWNNEGIIVRFPLDIYLDYLRESEFISMTLKQDSIILTDRVELENDFGEKVTAEEFDKIYNKIKEVSDEEIDIFFYNCGWSGDSPGKNKSLPDYKIKAIKADPKLGKTHVKNLLLKSRKKEVEKNLKKLEKKYHGKPKNL